MNALNLSAFRNEPVMDFSVRENQQAMRRAIAGVRKELDKEYFLVIGGNAKKGVEVKPSENPTLPTEIIGRIHFASEDDANEAVAAAARSFEKWARTPIAQRANCLLRAAEIMRTRRLELSAWEILECGKNWEEADADVCEAIDFLEYYARETLDLKEKKIAGRRSRRD